ncbi:MAG: DtxR family transcriptional regulator [Chloroflexi bacterium RBG_16_48_8]|nr:MAG: DtxR family transcriptional regulator [Chloroflexi bacterium RBG_16_48_8]
MQTQAVEDYLKAIYELQRHESRVSTTSLANRMEVTAASTTGMIKKLAGLKLITYEPYQGVELTQAGEAIALEVIRHHRLIEQYLAEALGVPWDQVDAEAEKWEHILSNELETRMDAILGYPKRDPHGAPIPSLDGHIPPSSEIRLSELARGQRAIISEVSDHNPEMLRYMGELGLFPQVEVTVLDVAPFDGPLTIRVGDQERSLGREVAQYILVREIKSSS